MAVGPTLCGKTQFVLELIRRSSSNHPPPERIVWCFGCYQNLFRSVGGVEFVEGFPDMNILDGGKKRTLLITNDLMSETDERVTKLVMQINAAIASKKSKTNLIRFSYNEISKKITIIFDPDAKLPIILVMS